MPQKIDVDGVKRFYVTRRNGFGNCEQTCINAKNNERFPRCKVNAFSVYTNYCNPDELAAASGSNCDNLKYFGQRKSHDNLGYWY